MRISSDLTSEDGDIYRVILSSGEDTFFVGDDVRALVGTKIEIVEVDLERINGSSKTSLSILYKIAELIGNFMEQDPDCVLYFFCDDIAPLPTKTTKKNIWPQEYRSRIFSGMFEHYSIQHESLSAVNIPIVIDAVGRPIYMHLIARAEHLAFIDTIKDYVMTNYGKPCIEDL